MLVEFRYAGAIPAGSRSVILDRDSHESARRAEWAAQRVGLGIAIFSYSDILARVPEGQNPIDFCAEVTGTAYEEQLKSMFAADASLSGQSWPNAVLAVVKYSDRIDLGKLALALGELPHKGKPVGALKFMSVEKLGVPRGYLGVTPECLMVPALFTPSAGETFPAYTSETYSRQVVDRSLRKLTKFCMLAGRRKADALVVIYGQNRPLGNKLDTFFNNYFGGRDFAIADIAEGRK